MTKRRIADMVSFSMMVAVSAFAFVALFAHQPGLVLLGVALLFLLLVMEYRRDQRSERRRREYWNSDRP